MKTTFTANIVFVRKESDPSKAYQGELTQYKIEQIINTNKCKIEMVNNMLFKEGIPTIIITEL